MPVMAEQAATAAAARDKLAQDLTRPQALNQRRAVERAMARDLDVKDARISERAALDRAGRAEGEVNALREQLVQDCHPLSGGGQRRRVRSSARHRQRPADPLRRPIGIGGPAGDRGERARDPGAIGADQQRAARRRPRSACSTAACSSGP